MENLIKNSLSPQRLRRLRRLATVPRWVVIPTIKKQSVAEHSFHVAYIALWVARFHEELQFGEFDGEIAQFALYHDELESWYGDLPSPARAQHMPNKHEFESQNGYGTTGAHEPVKQVLKIADLLEAYLFTWEEDTLGNKGLRDIQNDIHSKLTMLLQSFPWANKDKQYTFITEFKKAFDVEIHPVIEMEGKR